MTGARRQDQYVPTPDPSGTPGPGRQHHACVPGDDPEHLVSDRVKVVKREDPVPPGAKPPVLRKQTLARAVAVAASTS